MGTRLSSLSSVGFPDRRVRETTPITQTAKAPTEHTRRTAYLLVIWPGILVMLLNTLLHLRQGGHDPVLLYGFPLMSFTLAGIWGWLALGHSIQQAERFGYVMICLLTLAQILLMTVQPAVADARAVNSLYWMVVSLAALGYLMFPAVYAGRLNLILYLISFTLPLFGQALTRPQALPTLLTFQVTSGTALVLINTLARFRSVYIRQEVERETLQRLAHSDPLTGLFNRRALYPEIEALLAAARTGQPGVIMLLDLDHFKDINDQYGHNTGDEVLIRAGQLMQEHLPAGCRAGRWGGEEFMLLLPGLSASQGQHVAELLRLSFEQYPWPHRGPVTVSLGGVQVHPDSDDLNHLIARADSALYQAKATGRNHSVILN